MPGIFDKLLEIKSERGGCFMVLLDPDRVTEEDLLATAEKAEDCEVDALLVGSSLAIKGNFHEAVKKIKGATNLPVILFPGSHSQVSPYADAVLFTALLSGRNPQYLIEEQLKGAPVVKKFGLEAIPTAYLLIESGKYTSVQYMSNSLPIPSDKHDIVCAYALTAKYFGMKAVFLEAGSGAARTVPEALIAEVAAYADIPLIVGGGIRTPEEVESKIKSGASFVIVGNHFEKSGYGKLLEFARAAHIRESIEV